jgi:hypothetical protein
MGSLVSSLDLYNHSTVPSLGEPVGPVLRKRMDEMETMILNLT